MTTRAEIMSIGVRHGIGPGVPTVAVDVGGTGLKAALFDARGHLVDAVTAPAPSGGESAAADLVHEIVAFRDVLDSRHGLAADGEVAVVLPGIVDESTRTGVFSANLGWRQAPIGEMLDAALRRPVHVSHDVRAAGLAEFTCRAEPPQNAAMIAVGTGIAAALRMEGVMVSSGGFAGEIGFSEICVDTAEGPFRGPAEEFASAAAIARRYAERSGQEVAGSLEVLTRRQQGDPLAAAVWAESVEALGVMTTHLVAVAAPDEVVLGGGLSSAPGLAEELQAAVRARLDFHKTPVIRRATLGPASGLIGAGLLTRPAGRSR